MRRQCLKTWWGLTLSILALPAAFAQTGGKGVGNEEVIVVKEYEVKISDAEKVTMQPNIPEVEETTPMLSYRIPERDFKDFSFEANPLKPLSMSREKMEKYTTSFIKIGMGSQLMPLAQLAYNDNKSKNLKFGIFYNHLSAREFKKIRNQRFSDDEAGVYLKFFPNKTEIGTNFTFRNYRTHFYGVSGDTTLGDSLIKAKDVRQVFRTYDAQVYFKNSQRNDIGIDYKQSFHFNYLQETFGKANEWFIAGNTNICKTFLQHHSAGLDLLFDVSRLKNDYLTLQRTIFTFLPGYSFNNDDWRAIGKIGFTLDNKRVVFATEAYVEKRLYEHSVIAYLSYVHGLRKNSLLSYSQTNNFIQNGVTVRNTTAGDFGAGLKGTVQNFSYNVGFHFNHIKALPLFVNDSTDLKRFDVVYDSNTVVFNIHFEAGYNAKEWLRLLVMGDYNYYQLKNEIRAWHEPNLRVTFRANYVWKNKIVVGFDLYGITATYARMYDGTEKKLKGTADLNLNLEYLMNKHISFFGQLNNIAHLKYQRFNNYPTYGINGMIGAKFSF